MKLLAVCCLLLSALCLRAELAFKWTVEVSQPLPYAAEALQGETFNLEAKVVQYRVPMLEAAEATFYYQTPEMEASQWYTVPAAWDATTATASVAFTPAMDVGSTKYRFFFGIETAQGKNYRVFGTLRLKASPGFSPATLTPTDVRAEIIQEILEAVFEESDERYATKAEHAALAVQVDGKADASHTHSDLQQSATVLLQAINSEAEIREEADAALEAALAEEMATREEADVKLSAQVPVVRATLPNADNNANGYGYRGPLSRLGVYGEAVVIRRLAITTRTSGNQNTTVPLWARVVRNVDGAWVVYAQAKEPRKWEEVAPGAELAWEMEPVPSVLPPSADETVAIVWVNDPDAPAAQSNGEVSWRTVSVSGGINFALPNVPTTSSAIQSWSPRIVLDFTAVTKALKVDTSLSVSSTNPVQNKVVVAALDSKQNRENGLARMSVSMTPYDWYNDVLIDGAKRLMFYNTNVESMLLQSKGEEGSISWFTGAGLVTHKLGGGNTEVWKGNVGFGEQDTFFGPRKVADGDGQFQKGYPRLHNHGQDIHEVSGFSRDSRDDEDVWSHRLLLPWDLAKANDTSYLMAGVVWQSERLAALGGDTTFVQPLLPKNTGATASVLPQAIPCFENSPIFWNGHLIWEGTYAPKQIKMPWSRVADGTEAELALKSDIPSVDAAPWVNETNENYSHYLVNAREDLGDVGIRRAFAFAIDNTSNASIIYENGIFGRQEIPFDIVHRLYAKQDKLTAGENITIENGVISASGGGEPVAREGHAIAWQEGTSLLTVTPNADGAVVFDPTGWPEGQSLLVRLTTPEDFEGVPASVRLVGYFDIEPASTYQLTAYVVGGTLHVVPLLREE